MSKFDRGLHSKSVYKKRGVKIGKNVRIGEFASIDTKGAKLVYIGNNVVLGGSSRIITHCPVKGVSEKKMSIHIEDNVWMGHGCIILPGTHIKTRVLIGAGSVVSGVLESDNIYAGNPVRLVRSRKKCEIVRTYLLVKQGLVVSIPSIKPKWDITKKQLMKLFTLSEDDYTDEYDKLRDPKYCYEVLLNE